MRSPELSSSAQAALRKLRVPRDYFSETRTSLRLQPEKILCFVRRSAQEFATESLDRHHHHRYVLAIPWQEAGEVYVNERRFMLKPSCALLIFPFQFHHGFNFRREKLLWQFLTFEIRDGAALESLRLSPVRRLAGPDFQLLAMVVEVWNDSSRQDELADWLALFLKRMIKALPAKREQKPAASQSSSSLFLRINQYCQLHLHQLFGLKQLAAHLAISESHLRASFRRETGMSLGQHLRRLRLQKAMGLLLESDLSITQVAERCGFDSIFTFSRSFRRFAELTAREYRRRFSESRRPRARGSRKG